MADSVSEANNGRNIRRLSATTKRRLPVALVFLLAFAVLHDAGHLSLPRVFGQAIEGNDRTEETVREGGASAAAIEGLEDLVVTPKETHEPGSSDVGGHHDPVAPVLAAIVLILLLAKVGGEIFERMRLPAVLGELVLGVLLGNIGYLTGSEFLDFMQPPEVGEAGFAEITVGESLQILAGIGVVLLLFEVGLESTLRQMFSVGLSSVSVAIVGVVAPMALGYFVCRAFFFDEWQQPVFIGATLCATSVGITARVLKDIGRSKDTESRIILGAAVLDDVLGLIVLAVASGVIVSSSEAGGTEIPWEAIGKTIGWAVAFLGGALILGTLSVPKMVFDAAGYLRGHGLLIATALAICFGMSYLASLVGLATIVGAFAAGLILEQAHYHDLSLRENVELEEALHPLTALLVPVFFVQTGMGVKLSAMADSSTWILAITLTVIAVIGKLVCSLVVFEKGLNRLAVGLGMVPRGEVGLIFADQGRRLMTPDGPAISDSTFSAIVFMVMVTTLVAPPMLRWSMNRGLPLADAKPPDEHAGFPPSSAPP